MTTMLESLYTSQGSHTSLVRGVDPKSFNPNDNSASGRNGRVPFRPPRRAQSTNDYVYPSPPPLMRGESRTVLIHQNSANNIPQAALAAPAEVASSGDALKTLAAHGRPPTIDEETVSGLVSPGAVTPVPTPTPPPAEIGRTTRPKLGPPRRSYSVMDYEPVPHHHRLSENLGLLDLPPELHYTIFDFLDPIDSTCLGLTNKHFYDIHRRMHGAVPLSVRRPGPNDMEWVWHLAGRMMHGGHSDAATLEATTNALAMLRVRGQALCRKCGVSRCELHKHIQGWMGPGYEYCTVREKFGPAAPEGAKEFCYLSNPKDPHRCGRHRVNKSRPTTPVP
ncbi:f-box domain containing protein [Sporothrix brasiliensis 5110]|uniref:F-box domain containing protein n=1 Tax=Sporothrix brasiliensis 5110 TaxID=1398154 RepID=A0A0C2IIH7_9PEZI|nr:f-box domain containing protein [Sporothrix brasiliensis 5110]KIH86795.1 f-box domain containing protein [Sporothrix brasiliensis 5110]